MERIVERRLEKESVNVPIVMRIDTDPSILRTFCNPPSGQRERLLVRDDLVELRQLLNPNLMKKKHNDALSEPPSRTLTTSRHESPFTHPIHHMISLRAGTLLTKS